jgi:hypothetical protein
MAELIRGLSQHVVQLKRLSSTMPPAMGTAPASAPSVPIEVDTEPAEPAELAQLDRGTQLLLSEAIAQAVAAQLGRVRISSVPPPKSSMRAAADVGGKLGKWGVLASGGLSLLGSAIAIWRPEYAAPLSQALKLIAALLTAWGGGTPAGDTAPARDVPALVAPSPAAPAAPAPAATEP